MRIIKHQVFPAFLLACLLLFYNPKSHAAPPSCNAAAEGTIVYNSDHKAVQFCNGTDWISMSGNFGGSSLPTLNSAQILVGNASDTATAVTMSGDATLSNTGVLNIANNAIIGPEISAGSITNSHLAGSIALSKIAITGTADGSKYLRDDGSWQAVPSGADTLAALQCAEQESLKFEGGAWVCAEINALPDPPICTGSSAALQWDGTNWSCATVVAGGGGGPTIVNGDHTQQECIDAGGTINMSDFGGDILCLFSGTTCPSGWTSYGKWYRTGKTCTGNSVCSTTISCTLPGGWVASNGARSCTYRDGSMYQMCSNKSCSQAANVGVTTAACY